MFTFPSRRPLVAALFMVCGGAQAQGPRPDPLDAQASVPAVAWRSVLAPARPASAAAPPSWREANDQVARIGGWRVYAREAQPAASQDRP